jgi:hypothetical protein
LWFGLLVATYRPFFVSVIRIVLRLARINLLLFGFLILVGLGKGLVDGNRVSAFFAGIFTGVVLESEQAELFFFDS